jgi:tetratricopeptide (TPR) repeat protein
MKLLKSIANDPTNYEKALKVADYYYITEKYSRAIRYYKQAFALMPEREINCEYLKKLIFSLMEMKQTDAITYIEKGLKKECNKGKFLNYYVDALIFTIKKIEVQIKIIAVKNPALSKKLSRIRNIYIKKGIVITTYNEIKNDHFLNLLKEIDRNTYDCIIKYDKNNSYSRFILGKLAKDSELFEIAKPLLGSSYQDLQGKDKGVCFYYYGYIYYREHQYSEALRFYKKAKKYWNSTKVNYWLSKTYYNLGMKKRAIQSINYTLKMDSNYQDAIQFKEKITKGE